MDLVLTYEKKFFQEISHLSILYGKIYFQIIGKKIQY